MPHTEHYDHYVTNGCLSAVINAASGGDREIVAAPGAGKRIRVHGWVIAAQGNADVRFESAAAGTAMTGVMRMSATAPNVAPFNPVGWFTCGDNEALSMELATADVDGVLVYSIVPNAS